MKKSFMERLAAFIVDKRRLFVVLFAVACVLSIFSASKTDVNNELTDYLPDSTQTRQGLEIMNSEFITYGDAKVMVSNVTLAQAEELYIDTSAYPAAEHENVIVLQREGKQD